MPLSDGDSQTRERLIRRRAIVKGQLTTFRRKLDEYSENPDLDAVKIFMERVEKSFEDLSDITIDLECIEPGNHHEIERQTMEDELVTLTARVRKLEREASHLDIHRAQTVPSPSPFASTTGSIRLPEQKLPNFDGLYENWLSFRDDFETSIGTRQDISDPQKLKYLRSCLVGEPQRLVRSFSTTNDSFREAWKLLKDTFEHKGKILERHTNAIFDIPAMQRESPSELNTLVNTVQLHLSALKALGEPVEKWSTVLVFFILNKVDKTTRREWKRTQRGNETPTFENLTIFLRETIIATDDTPPSRATRDEKPSVKPKGHPSKGKQEKWSTQQQCFATTMETPCSICKESPHVATRCQKFKMMSSRDRHEIAVQQNLCLNCLRPEHKTKECTSKYTCMVCRKKHHTWLHLADTKNTSVAPSEQEILVTAIVEIKDKLGRQREHRALFDTCSTTNFMTNRLATSLGLEKKRCSIPISSMNQTRSTTNFLIKATISSRFNSFTRTLHFLTVNTIAGLIPDDRINRKGIHLPKNKPLADPLFDQPGEIDLLIGSGPTLSSLCVGQVRLSKANEPDLYLQNTRFGWIVGGRVPLETPSDSVVEGRSYFLSNMEKIMNRFWQIEEITQPDNQHPRIGSCEEHFLKNVTRDSDGRYSVALPFNEKITLLGETRAIAEKRLAALERKLRKDLELRKQYHAVLQEYLDLGHMERVIDPLTEKGFYLPHHAVVKETSATTKVRVVFDGSAKSSSGTSLNDALMVGPTIQTDLFSLWLRFRSHNYVITGDVEKMYRQFWIRKDDRRYQRILWRDSDGQVITYELNTVTFGLSSAPYLAIRCLHQLAEDEGREYPSAAEAIKKDFYVDDLLTGAPTVEEALRLRNEISGILERGKLRIRQWASNDRRLMEGLPSSHVNLKLQSREDPTIKTLGVHWNSERDHIVYTVCPNTLNGRVTKRTILSDIAKIFDPLGLLGPVITFAKLVMQELWHEKLGWDDPIPLAIHTKWLDYTTQLPNLNELSFTRRVTASTSSEVQLHGFCDASERAYGACLYVRSKTIEGRVTSTLLCSKGRVAPLKGDKRADKNPQMTIPRLELCAAQLLARLYTTVCEALPSLRERTTFWSDSTIALHWIRTNPDNLLPFVSNRVSDIQTRTDVSKWRHVRSADNPADLISRGQTPEEFVLPSIWANGPAWMLEEEGQWPSLGLPSLERVPETRTIKCLATPIQYDVLERFSSITRLRRIIAYCLRFKNKNTGLLSCGGLQKAEHTIIKLAQSAQFSEELRDLSRDGTIDKTSKLTRLHPFIDERGVLRVGGHLRHSAATYGEKHPMILPRGHHVTRLITRYEHIRNYHSGTQATLYSLRRKYWIIDGRNQVRKVIRDCISCNKMKPVTSECIMGDLPDVRVTEARPFLNVGIDYCGPFFIKEKKLRNRGRVKIYVAVFVCMAVKAVHLELVTDLTSQGFIATLKRFVARRGLCKRIYSDNGTNFVGANNELKDDLKHLMTNTNNDMIQHYLTEMGIEWHFMPPRSPNFGGLWESAVKAFKRHLRHVVGDRLFTYEEFYTFLVEIEAILNSRPLTPISSDPNDLLVLSPGHFLIGTSLTSVPERDRTEIPENRLSTWQHIQKVKRDFWKRWHREYLTELNLRSKWTHGSRNIEEGTLVLIKEDNQPPLRWPMGRVIETLPGPDGIVRVVRIKTPRGISTRNVRSLAPLPKGAPENSR